MDIERLKKWLSKYDIISFDIFDTLILRRCNKPSDVFTLVAEELNIDPEKFSSARIKAESIARNKAADNEISLNDIYQNLNGYNESEKEMILEKEVDVEISIVYPNKEMVELLNYFFLNKKIIIISDMYLDRSAIVNILKKCDIVNYETLYLSSELNKKKSNGSMFEFIRNQKIYANKSIIHIGDNLKSDFLIPKKIWF